MLLKKVIDLNSDNDDDESETVVSELPSTSKIDTLTLKTVI